jgi:putative NIF3 family GTP cyclohydrolase 1 type 2
MGGAKRAGAQALVTGEAKHNLLLEAAELGLTLVDAGHYATETVVLEPLARRLGEIFPEADVTVAKSGGDGVRYL